MNKTAILALLACAGLGFAAGRSDKTAATSAQVYANQSAGPQRSEPGPATEGQPVESPLVAKLIPQPVKVQAKAKPTVLEGQLSKGGNFRYESARNIWVPVDKGNRRYTHGGRPVGAAHLIEHGHHPSCVYKWTQSEMEIAHANDHAATAVVKAAPVSYSSCPNGQCGNPSYRRGLFGRRM